jgi:hypothetical protein
LARKIRGMPSAVRLREDYSARELRALARGSKDANQSRRLLSLAAVLPLHDLEYEQPKQANS